MSIIPWFKKRAWRIAQQKEFIWWDGVSKDGYAQQNPSDFISIGQKAWMLKQLKYLDRPLDYWEDKIVVEFGPGPAGIVEYLSAKRKFGVEPLYQDYYHSFPHLRDSDVVYLSQAAEETLSLESELADLSICFNVIDHVYSPKKVIKNIFRVTKPGADLLFQVNVFDSKAEAKGKTGLHAELHPHSFTEESAIRLLESQGFELIKKRISKDTNPEGEKFLLIHLRRPLN
jgi:SAM-dependent methyltransferase